MALAYIDARDVMERLDAVCGPDGWQCRYPHAQGKTVCEIGIRVDGQGEYPAANPEWVWKSDGAGDTDFEADKGALSDAFKRAAVRWGIGRYLYDLSAPWVEIEPMGKSFKIKEGELPKLMKLLGQPASAAQPQSKSGPTPGGPLPKTKLVEKLRLFCADLPTAETEDELAAILHGYKAVLDQCERDLPNWWIAPPEAESPGIKQRIEDRKAYIAKRTHNPLAAA
jgi:hypothetical protein